MAEITASLVKELREKTGAGMMDCKKALGEVQGDLEKAVDWLRTKGLSAAAKKAGRIAAEGLVGVVASGNRGAVVEVNAETDFVGRNEIFQKFVAATARIALDTAADMTKIAAAPFPGAGRDVQGELTNMIATIGENMSLRRAASLSVSDGVVAAYMHNSVAPELGKIGVLVALESTGDKAKLAALAKQLAMHVAAAKPQSLTVADLDKAAIERERGVLAEKAAQSGKAADIIAKMVEGGLRKFHQEVVLLEQLFVIDGKSRVAKVVDEAAKQVGAPVRLAGFLRFALGEGIEKKSEDFAATAHVEAWSNFKTVGGRRMDGAKLYFHLTDSPANKASDGIAALAGMDAHVEQAFSMIGSAKFRKAFDLKAEPEPVHQLEPDPVLLPQLLVKMPNVQIEIRFPIQP
jgi:elongation factor Ts